MDVDGTKNHPHFGSVSKPGYNDIKKSLFMISQKLGGGVTSCVAYDTAWVARIPKTDDLCSPAFPLSLKWLRVNQQEDGSWGSNYPYSVHSKILNTFSAILALHQWNFSEDRERKERGLKALAVLAKNLQQEKTKDLGFEMVLSSFLDDAFDFQLNIPFEKFEWFSNVGKYNLRKNEKWMNTNIRNKHWIHLEAAGKTLDLDVSYYSSEIARYGLISAQPSTTAFILRRARTEGRNFSEAQWVLEKLCQENDGGMPRFASLDNLEIIYGMDFLLKAGINHIKNTKFITTKNSLRKLEERWDPKAGIGFSSKWPIPDAECSATALKVLCESSLIEVGFSMDQNDEERVKTSSHHPERETKEKHHYNGLELTLSKEIFLLNDNMSSEINVSKYFVYGKWNVSTFFHIMKYLIESKDVKTEYVVFLSEMISRTQKNDGGWGGQTKSSVEETAFVSIAIFHLISVISSSDILSKINFLNLIAFMEKANDFSSDECVWCSKVTFSSAVLSEAALVGAKFAIFQLQRISSLTRVFNDSKLELSEITIKGLNNELIFEGNCIRLRQDVSLKEVEIDKKQVHEIIENDILQKLRVDSYVKKLIDNCLNLSYLRNAVKLTLYDRIIDVVFWVFLLLIDDVVDEVLPRKSSSAIEELKELLKTVTDILSGEYKDSQEGQEVKLPYFSHLKRLLYYYRKVILEKNGDISYLLKEFRIVGRDAFTKTYMDFCRNIQPTSRRYLQLHKISTLLEMTIHHDYLIHGIEDFSKFFKLNLFSHYINSANKAVRFWIDFPSVLKDVELPNFDNYCLRLQQEYHLSVPQSVEKCVKRGNREILKMYTLKNLILSDPELSSDDYEALLRCMEWIEAAVDGALRWSLTTSRYHSEWQLSCKRTRQKREDLSFVYNLCFE